MTELAEAIKQLGKWKDRRDTIVRKLAESGLSLREIAEESGGGLSHAGVAKILRRGEQ